MEQFGKYQLARRIGSGGMAEVFLARTTVAQGLNKQLVIKKIHPAFARSNQFVAMFVDEAKIALGLNHPNIVQVFDFGTVGKTFFLAMEHVDGLDLLRLMQACAEKKVRIPYGLASYIVQQVAKGLDYAHRKTDEFGDPLGIVHRDISPQNVLISWDGAVKIVDFGIARARHVNEEAGVIKGKFAYMSPEQARGDEVDRRSDVFSAGVVLFEVACGRQLFQGKGKAVLDKVKTGAITRPRFVRPDLPKELEQIILESLSFHPDDRFDTARDLQNSLGRFQFQHAQSANELFDSGALAQFVSRVIPAENRRSGQLAPLAQASGTPASRPSSDIGSVVQEVKGSPEIRERKHVFVLEGQICGVPALEKRLGAEGARAVVEDFFNVARNIAFKHEAHVHIAEASALTFIVGLPVSAENDGSRAIRLALALVDALDGIGHDVEPELRLAVGMQRGVADITRPRGGREFTYVLADSTTAIARKLAGAAQGAEVLVGGRVYRIARDEWNFEKLTSIDIPSDLDTQPGVEDSDTEPGTTRARVYRLRGRKERAQRMRERAGQVKLVGRDLEMKALRDIYRSALVDRSKRTFAIIGDAGVGKRSMVTQFLAGIQPSEAVVIRAAARVSTAYTPFSIIADLARDLLGLADGAAPTEVHKRLERVAALLYPGSNMEEREVRGIVSAMDMLLGGRSENEEEGDIDADERRHRILQAMRRVESGLSSDKALVVVGEDVHWADDESIDLFLQLLKLPSNRPIVGVVTSRPDPRVERLARESNAELVRIEELPLESARALITRQFSPGEDVEALADQILARTGGNPFFIREVLDSLEERGIIVAGFSDVDNPGLLRWVKRDAPIQVPTSVESLLATRLDGLAELTKETAVHAAILGRSIPKGAIDALLGRDSAAQLEELVAKGIMVARGSSFAFRNDMIMTVAYGLLPDDERSRLHHNAAKLMLGSSAYRAGQDDAVIARHLELAGDAAAAAERYLAAANHAVNVGGNADAFRQLSRALNLLESKDHERRFRARSLREQILGRLARRPEQLREIHKLRQEAEALGDPARVALAYARQAQFYIDVGKAPAAKRAVGPSLEHARKAGDKLAEAEALRLRSSIARLVGNNEEALELCQQALALCGDDRAGIEARATILNNRGTTLWNMSRLQEAIESYAEALVIYRALKLPRLEARALNNMGIVFAALGEFEESLAHYKSSLKIDQKLGDRASLALKLGNIGQTYSDLGDTEKGERYLVKALAIADQMNDRSSATDAAISLGQVYLAQGRYRKCLDLLERGLALATENRERYQEIRALIYLSMAQLEDGQPAEGALELAVSATELARKMPMPVGEIYGLAAQAMALCKLDRAGEAVAKSARATKLQEDHDQPEGSEQVLHIHAQAAEQAGLIDEARGALRKAIGEVRSKAERISDEALRSVYLSSRVAAAVAKDHARLVGD